MEYTQPFTSSSITVPSPQGNYIASVTSAPPRLTLRSTATLELVRAISFSNQLISKTSALKWSPGSANSAELSASTAPGTERFLLANDDTVRVWDVHDEDWAATVEGSGAGAMKMAHVEFGRSADEVLIFSDCAVKLTIWSLVTGRSIEIRDPKFATKGHGFRDGSGHLALLTRSGPQDILTIHEPKSYELVNSVVLSTVDAQGLKWSPDGKWIAIWDSASNGSKVLFYTADGHLYRTYNGKQSEPERPCGLGVKTIEWKPGGEFIAIGHHDDEVAVLGTRTFSPVVYLVHPTTITIPDAPIWEEQIDAAGERTYINATQPVCPPAAVPASSDTLTKIGISSIAFNQPSGTLMATKSDQLPTTVWIWSASRFHTIAVLVHHSPVTRMQWHPTNANLLLIQCAPDDGRNKPAMHLWSSTWSTPRIAALPSPHPAGRLDARWVRTAAAPPLSFDAEPSQLAALTNQARCPTVMLADAHAYVLGYVQEGEEEEKEGQDDGGFRYRAPVLCAPGLGPGPGDRLGGAEGSGGGEGDSLFDESFDPGEIVDQSRSPAKREGPEDTFRFRHARGR